MIRYLLIVPALALLGAAPPAPNLSPQAQPTRVISPVPSTCAKIGANAQGEQTPPQMKRLGQLPPAEAYMAVLRTDENGCLDPLLARDRHGIRRP
jgi:hypothetical protein